MSGRPWTEEEKQVVREMYADYFASEIAEKLGRTPSGVWTQASKMGLKSSKEKIIRSAKIGNSNPKSISTRFQKGHIPCNQGKPISPEVYEKIKATMFKKGNRPHNSKPVGSERVNVDGYVEVKIAEPSTWELKHRVVWASAHGEIPEGHIVHFKDKNKQNFDLNNLCLLSHADFMAQNTVHRYPAELVEVMRIKGCITRQINKHKNKRQKDGK